MASLGSQVKMFPGMMNSKIAEVIESYRDKTLAWKLSGAGGGGYLIHVSEHRIPNSMQVNIRLMDYWI